MKFTCEQRTKPHICLIISCLLAPRLRTAVTCFAARMIIISLKRFVLYVNIHTHICGGHEETAANLEGDESQLMLREQTKEEFATVNDAGEAVTKGKNNSADYDKKQF